MNAIIENQKLKPGKTYAIPRGGSRFEILNVESCDKCGCPCDAGNGVTITGPANIICLHWKAEIIKPEAFDFPPELGCDDSGNCLCPGCFPN